jgi:predicted dehydrogenase
MAHKIRLGFVGANVRSNWASQSHFPALLASPDVELTAVCTTRPESAEEARDALGATLAFHDVRAMVASPEIDAVAVVVRMPAHYERRCQLMRADLVWGPPRDESGPALDRRCS